MVDKSNMFSHRFFNKKLKKRSTHFIQVQEELGEEALLKEEEIIFEFLEVFRRRQRNQPACCGRTAFFF